MNLLIALRQVTYLQHAYISDLLRIFKLGYLAAARAVEAEQTGSEQGCILLEIWI